MPRAELSPAELDRLEDALEDLELLDVSELSADDPVGERLVEFRELLSLSREAMPLQEVPAGVLDEVLAEARQAAANTAPAPAKPWWSRLRLSLWVPTLAFAGSAALLLVMLWPGAEDEAPAEAVARTEPVSPAAATPEQPAELRLADANASKDAAEGDAFGLDGKQADRGAGLQIGERAPEPDPEPEAVVEEEAAEDEAPRTQSTARARKGGGGSLPGAAPPPAPKPSPKKNAGRSSGYGDPPSEPLADEDLDDLLGGSKSKGSGGKKAEAVDLWPEIVEGDRQRHEGACGLAEMRYDKARQSANTTVRARALAGLGLCKLIRGNEGGAEKLFEQARAADPGVQSFITAERKKIEAAPQQAAPPTADQADEAPPSKE